MNRAWCIGIGEDVSLTTPTGVKVEGLPHKVRALLAALGVLSPEPLGRREAGDILWPRSPLDKQQTNLRQALTVLRRTTGGAPFLDAGRSAIGLRSGLAEVERVSGEALLVGFAEPWFVLLRSSESAARQSVIGEREGGREASAVRSLEDLLEWTIAHQPNQAYGIIYHAVDLALSLPPHRALSLSKQLLRAGALNHPMRGWANLLHAFALFYCLEMTAAAQAFRELRRSAASLGDVDLMAMAAFFEAGCVLPMGRLDHATHVLAETRARGGRLSARSSARLAHGTGLAACCRGEYEAGVRALRLAVERAGQAGESYEQAYAAVNLAWMAASVEHVESARWALEVFDEVDTGAHYRFHLTACLARLHQLCNLGQPDQARALGEDALDQAKAQSALGFEIYLRESLARCHALGGDPRRAQEEILEASKIRQRIGWALVPWDEDRLAVVVR